jgi:hypothetical protein
MSTVNDSSLIPHSVFSIQYSLFLLLLTISSSSASASAPTELDSFLDAWAEKGKTVRSLSLRFRQEKKLRILRRPKISEGELLYADKQLWVRMRGSTGDVESELLLEKGQLKILYPRLKRLEILDVGEGASGKGFGMETSIPFFAVDPRQAKKNYEVTLERRKESDFLTLTPRGESAVKRLELELVDFEVRRYRQFEKNGDEMLFEVLSVEINAEVPQGSFELKVPPGTRTVRPLAGQPRKKKSDPGSTPGGN